MKEINGELWSYYAKPNTIVLITTNGTITKDGKCVMGRGCALEARNRFPGIDRELGRKIKSSGGNVVHILEGGLIYSFPVKHQWSDSADIQLIANSAALLGAIATFHEQGTFVLPRPGCGNGRLRWENVKPVLEFLPDNVLIISK